MILRSFLKYFRPFLGRLIVAMCGMVLVGVLTAAPLLIAREAIFILIGDKFNEGGQKGLAGVAAAAYQISEAAPAAGTPDAKAAPGAAGSEPAAEVEAKPSLSARLDGTLSDTLGRAYSAPREWIGVQGERAGDWLAWYRARARSHPMQALRILVVALILITVIKGAAEFIAKYQVAHTFFLSNLKMREDIFGNVLRQDYLYFNNHSAGFLHSRINSDVKAIGEILEAIMHDGFQQPITLACMFAVLLYISPTLTLGVLVVLPLVAGILYYFARVLRKNARKQKKQADMLSSALTESLTNIRLVKALGTEELEQRKFHLQSMALFRFMMARRVAKFGSSPLMEILGSLAVGAVLLLAGWMVLSTPPRMHFADLMAFFWGLQKFYRPLRNIANMTNKYQVARVSGERILAMLALRPEVRDEDGARPFTHVERAIAFEGVGFRYGDKEILRDVSLTVPAGRRVAFVGPSGAGKTTAVNLLARLFDPSEGRILVDGIDLRTISLRDWRAHLAIVTQDTFLFDDTIAANIAYGSPEVDMARVEAAAVAANAHEFIMMLDGGQGYRTKIGPTGARLSGGQRQRLAIARAIYRDPKILILDEATSALDVQSQRVVQEALNHLMHGRTTFIIAHRISTVRNVDCIYVLDQGRIVESGTHEQLQALGGLYANLAAHGGAQREAQAVSTQN